MAKQGVDVEIKNLDTDAGVRARVLSFPHSTGSPWWLSSLQPWCLLLVANPFLEFFLELVAARACLPHKVQAFFLAGHSCTGMEALGTCAGPQVRVAILEGVATKMVRGLAASKSFHWWAHLLS